MSPPSILAATRLTADRFADGHLAANRFALRKSGNLKFRLLCGFKTNNDYYR